MTVFLNNTDQMQCLNAAEAIDGMELGMRQWARGDAIRRPRIDNFLPTSRADEFFVSAPWKVVFASRVITHCVSNPTFCIGAMRGLGKDA